MGDVRSSFSKFFYSFNNYYVNPTNLSKGLLILNRKKNKLLNSELEETQKSIKSSCQTNCKWDGLNNKTPKVNNYIVSTAPLSLTFLQDNLYHDAVSGFSRLTRHVQRVTAVVVQVVVVSHVGTDPGHACGGAEGARPAELSYLRLTTQSPDAQAGPHHQSQQALFDLLHKDKFNAFSVWTAL